MGWNFSWRSKTKKSSNYKDEIQNKYFTGGKVEMTYITVGKALLTLYYLLDNCILISFLLKQIFIQDVGYDVPTCNYKRGFDNIRKI